VALMAQQYPALTASQAEGILDSSALALPPGSLLVNQPAGPPILFSWGADATGAGLATASAALAATP
jgi:hypothetical protein